MSVLCKPRMRCDSEIACSLVIALSDPLLALPDFLPVQYERDLGAAWLLFIFVTDSA